MSKIQKALLCVVMIFAIGLTIFLLIGYRNDGERLAFLQEELANSRTVWETIAEEKETLLDELDEANDALREAQLTLEESTERANELREEIETLKKDIENLKNASESE